MEAQNGAPAVAEPTGVVPTSTIADGQGAAGAGQGSPGVTARQAEGGAAIPQLPDGFDVTQLPQVRELQSSMDRQIQELKKSQQQEATARQQQEQQYQQQLQQAENMRQEYLRLQMAGMTDVERAEAMKSEYELQNQQLQQQIEAMQAQAEQQKILNEMSALSGLPADQIPTTSYFDATQAVLGHVAQTSQEKDETIAALQAEIASFKRGNQEASSIDVGVGVPSTPSNTLQQQYNQAAQAVLKGTGETAQLEVIKDQARASGVTLDFGAWRRM